MDIVCRDCRGNAFRILPAAIRTVTAECLACGTLTSIEIPKADAMQAELVNHSYPPHLSSQTLGNL
jgi:hypothetical protein